MSTTVIPKKNRDDLYRFFFTEGVVACQKNRLGKWRATLGGKRIEMPINHVMHLMRQLKSRGLLKEQFAWRTYYWFLNDAGVAFMRKYLFLADNVVPNTQRKPEKEENFERRPQREEGGERRGRGRGGRGGRGGDRPEGEQRRGGRGAGRGRGFGGDRKSYHSDPNAEGAAAGAEGEQRQDRPYRGRGRGRAAAAAPAQE